jgi:competence protein ComEC
MAYAALSGRVVIIILWYNFSMPTPRKRPTAARRRQPAKRRSIVSANRSFFIIMVILALFAAVFTFFGDRFFPESTPNLPGQNEIFVHFINVGQGDATLIQSADHAVLIDGGEPRYGQQIVTYLRNAGVTRLDYVVATHPHSDHIGGLVTVLGNMDVRRVVMPDAANNTVAFENFLAAMENHDIPVTIPTVGDRLAAGIINMTVLAPTAGTHANINNASIALRMVHGHTSFLFTGDAEAASEQAMLAGGHELRSTVLHVGHHGSRTSTSQAFLDAVSPVAAVISAGAGNIHNHPHRDVLDRLNAANVRILRTDERGTVVITTDGNDVRLW